MPENGKHIYFASDFHLGVPDHDRSLQRERKLVNWLDSIKDQAAEIFLMGDVFDFWFEYKTVVPKGFVRLLGKLAEITDQGIPVHVFRGNHDIWAFDYLEKEVGVQLHRLPATRTFNGKKFYLAHGDGLGPGDNGYKFLKKVFENKFNQWLFRWFHPDLGTRMGLYFSHKSRIANVAREQKNNFKVIAEDEMLYHYCQSLIQLGEQHDFYIFGHRHVPLDYALNERSRMIILGDWVTNFTYAVFDGEKLELKHIDA
ncbi:MAG: UDP-2,3-diacylglucosamine diphosphatase [Bacteroidetes bacterium]|jgi:UDP-2,3-diacylglucosamine hydrolase|nr:UDP-2,3-diacylglucosamine diphosphatase [Bacteroidota bacterium]